MIEILQQSATGSSLASNHFSQSTFVLCVANINRYFRAPIKKSPPKSAKHHTHKMAFQISNGNFRVMKNVFATCAPVTVAWQSCLQLLECVTLVADIKPMHNTLIGQDIVERLVAHKHCFIHKPETFVHSYVWELYVTREYVKTICTWYLTSTFVAETCDVNLIEFAQNKFALLDIFARPLAAVAAAAAAATRSDNFLKIYHNKFRA